jgi:hypothetical protein
MSSVPSKNAKQSVPLDPKMRALGRVIRNFLYGAITTLMMVPCVAEAKSSVQETAAQIARPVASRAVQVDTADLAIPSAQEVIIDLPSAFYAARHQRGEVNGLSYILFPDGSGKIMQVNDRRKVLFRFECNKGTSCTITDTAEATTVIPAVGAPKPAIPDAPAGADLARYLAEWVLAGSGEPPKDAQLQTAELANGKIKPDAKPVQIAEPVPAEIVEHEAVVEVVEKPIHPKIAEIRKTKPIQKAQRNTPKAKATTKAPQFQPARLRPVPRKATVPPPPPAQKETFFQRIKLNCSITGSVTLRYADHNSGFTKFGKPRASFGCGAQLTKKLSLRLSAIGYGNKNEKSPSDADFTYALTYRATDKITLSYSNYSARFDSSASTFADSLTSGSLRASYRLPRIKLPNDKTIGCSASIGLPKPNDTTANLTCSHALTDKLRISGTAYAYFSGQQESYDPDFAYSASYRINDDWSLSYSNYANNRFLWNKSKSPREGILGGTLSLSYKFKF